MKKTLTCAAAVAALLAAGAASAAGAPEPATTPSTATTPATPPAETSPPVNPDPTAAPGSTMGGTMSSPSSTTTPPSTSATTGSSADANATATAPLAVGMAVKDNTGAEIGKIVELKPDASGANMATIQMGTDKFAVATTSIGVDNGVGVINLSKADLQAKLHPGH